MTIGVGGPIHRYLSITGISLEEFFELIKEGHLGAITLLAHEAIYCELVEKEPDGERLDFHRRSKAD